MALTLDDLLTMVAVRPAVPVDIPGVGSLWFRHPTFEEWHEVTNACQKLAGEPPSVALICRTVAIAVSDESGKPLMTQADARKLTDRDAAAVLKIFNAAVENVFAVDDERVAVQEKN